MHLRYSFSGKSDEYAYAQRYNLDASYKDLCEVCRSVKGMPTSKAVELLSKAEKMEIPIKYWTHRRKLGHRRGIRGEGRYPVKAASIVKKVILNAINNARAKQLDEDTLVVQHAAATKQSIYPRLSPKGRRMRWDYETARVEVVLKGNPRVIAEMSLPKKKEEVAEGRAAVEKKASKRPRKTAEKAREGVEKPEAATEKEKPQNIERKMKKGSK
ncbi:MAG: 50S ribosomal protein L22 [Candidatus Micrarchaeia archaeon]